MKLAMKSFLFSFLPIAICINQFLAVPTDCAEILNKGSCHGATRRAFYSRRKPSQLNDEKLLFRGGGDEDKGQKSSIPLSVFNLVNNVAGAGILTLSSGVAAGTGWIPAIIVCTILAALSGHCFSIIGEACELTGEATFKGLWKRTIGEKSTYLVDSMIATMCLSCSVIYSGILGDVFTSLLRQTGFPNQWNGRASNIVIISAVVLLPLCLIKDLSALAFTSVLGFTSILYTVLFVLTRFFDGSYRLPGGKYLQDGLIVTPAFKTASPWNFGLKSLVLTSNLGLAYIAHYNAPNYYRSLKNSNSKRFRLMVNISFFILATLYTVTMIAGYATFGDVCRGNILLNYHPDDLLSTFGRLATGLSILFGFPLVFSGAREAIIGLASSFGKTALGSEKNNFSLVSGILTFVTIISCTVPDVSLVVGLTGAVLGSTLVYVCPPFIYTKAVALVDGADSIASRRSKLNLALVPFGLFLGVVGCYMTIKEASIQ